MKTIYWVPLVLLLCACTKKEAVVTETEEAAGEVEKLANLDEQPEPTPTKPVASQRQAQQEPGKSPAPVNTPLVTPGEQLRVFFDEGVYNYKGTPLQRSARAVRQKVTVSASSVLCEGPQKRNCHGTARIWDNKEKTAWCEGDPGRGAGQWVAFDLGAAREITMIQFTPGYAKDRQRWFANGRVKEVEVQTDTARYLASFGPQPGAFPPGGAQFDYQSPILDFTRDPKIKGKVVTRQIKFLFKAVYAGTKYKDLCLSEIAIFTR